jgi:glycosyltransferase involved in cell wall biosynthesis
MVVDAGDPEAWSDAILASDLEELGRRARQRYEKDLNWRTIAERMMARMNR